MFESQYNEEMATEVRRLEAKQRAEAAGNPEWDNACTGCGCRLQDLERSRCDRCLTATGVRPVTREAA